MDGCREVENRMTNPSVLQLAILARLHRSHAGQLAMVDAAQYIWWPRMHRDIFQMCKNCPQCTNFGKYLKSNLSFDSSRLLPKLLGPNEEDHFDYAGPLQDHVTNQMYSLVAID